jgi:hypothetical protein
MSELQHQIKAVRKMYPPDELKHLFINRLDEEMFFDLGRLAYPAKELNRDNSAWFVWTGYELAKGINQQ